MWSLLVALSFLLISVPSRDALCDEQKAIEIEYSKKLHDEFSFHLFPIEAVEAMTDTCLDVVKCKLNHFASSAYENQTISYDLMVELELCLLGRFHNLRAFSRCHGLILMKFSSIHSYLNPPPSRHMGQCILKEDDFFKVEEFVREKCDMDSWLLMMKNEKRVRELFCSSRDI